MTTKRRRRRVRVLWARVAGLAALLVAGIAVGGPLLAAAGADVDGDPPPRPLDPTDWRAVALDAQTQLERTRRRSRRAHRLAARRGRIIGRLRQAMRAHDEGWARTGLRCIQPHEAGWQASTGNGYFGGLQMDLDFQRTYGLPLLEALGTADHWPPAAQLAVGEIAVYSGRGYGPWPQTRKACGL
ncbi:MAG TPA: hypothetical protein VKB54_07005 [Solirubrobacteraceae bacterium]|nr:hypothetical protein [Solirubrobacteraceae bacterium]